TEAAVADDLVSKSCVRTSSGAQLRLDSTMARAASSAAMIEGTTFVVISLIIASRTAIAFQDPVPIGPALPMCLAATACVTGRQHRETGPLVLVRALHCKDRHVPTWRHRRGKHRLPDHPRRGDTAIAFAIIAAIATTTTKPIGGSIALLGRWRLCGLNARQRVTQR